jgi:branched-chain amino acid transport system substrate-binding protein
MARRMWLLAAAAVAIAGCGTTVTAGSSAGTTALSGVNGDLGAPTQPNGQSATGLSGASGLTAVGGPATATGSTAGGGGNSQGAGGTSGSTGSSAPLTGNGFDATHVYIGVGTADDTSTYAASLGYNVNPGDGKLQAQALIDYINKHGGLVGRQIVPVFHDINDAQYNSDASGAVQAECADWTQDHHVFAAINAAAYPENGIACLAKAHTVALTSAPAGPVVGSYLAKYSPYFYAPGMADTTHFVRPFVDQLVRESYFGPWDTTAGAPGKAPVRIGVMYAADRPDLLDLTTKALAAHGMKVTDSFYLAASADASQLANAILKFKTDGVTHVLTYGFLYVVPTVAEKEGYRPRYGVSSWDAFQLAVSSGPAQQFAGSLGVGWTPLEDVDAGHDPGESVAEEQCLAIMKNSGQDTTNRSTDSSMAATCEQFMLLQDALQGATALSPASVQVGVERLGSAFGSSMTVGERFAPGRHAGVAAFLPIHFDGRCTCYDYFGSKASY